MSKHRQPVDPGKPHAFGRVTDGGLSAASSGALGRMDSDLTSVAVTSAYVRQQAVCAIPGCGRPRDDDRRAVAND